MNVLSKLSRTIRYLVGIMSIQYTTVFKCFYLGNANSVWAFITFMRHSNISLTLNAECTVCVYTVYWSNFLLQFYEQRSVKVSLLLTTVTLTIRVSTTLSFYIRLQLR